MTDQISSSIQRDPVHIAQAVLNRLQELGLEPTPEAYQTLYNELSGAPTAIESEGVLPRLARLMARTSTDAGLKLANAIESRNWNDLGDQLVQLIKSQSNTKQKPSPFNDFAQGVDRKQQWRDLLTRTLIFTIPSLLQDQPILAAQAEKLGNAVKSAETREEIFLVSTEIKSLYFQISQYAKDTSEKQMYFLRLLYLTMESIKDVLIPGSWLIKEIEEFQRLMREPMNQVGMAKAIRHLREVVYKNKRSMR